MARNNLNTIILVVIMVAITLLQCSLAEDDPYFGKLHKVGGNKGWTTPKNPDFYFKWSESQTFNAGEYLEFSYSHEYEQDVMEVTLDNFLSCNNSSPLHHYTEPYWVHIVLPEPHRTYFFIRGLPELCSKGQKVPIKVV
ncbi:hypothetical protein RIF29_15079 [Crotalaria pallida]|uniref:Phytocyanin domain-containing protein n=1 Tax=Crotalaria pallida TaxID=3830 RepID=A0AAN9FEJ8_CROPI